MKNVFSQIGGLFRLIRQPGGLRAAIRYRPFSITSFRIVQTLKRQGFEFKTVVDGGANVGQFSRAAIEAWPEAIIHAFEPIPEVAQSLRHNLANRPSVHVHECALGPEAGTTTFYRHKYSLASSVLPSRTDTSAAEPLSAKVRRMDEVLDITALKRPVLIKLDLQGYELHALRGAVATLEQTEAVLVEVSFDDEYVGAATFDDLYTFLTSRGFRIRNPVDFLTNDTGAISQLDILFSRAES